MKKRQRKKFALQKSLSYEDKGGMSIDANISYLLFTSIELDEQRLEWVICYRFCAGNESFIAQYRYENGFFSEPSFFNSKKQLITSEKKHNTLSKTLKGIQKNSPTLLEQTKEKYLTHYLLEDTDHIACIKKIDSTCFLCSFEDSCSRWYITFNPFKKNASCFFCIDERQENTHEWVIQKYPKLIHQLKNHPSLRLQFLYHPLA